MSRNLCAFSPFLRLRFAALLGLLGLLLFWPALHSPFVLDDYLQASMSHHTYPVQRAPWDLYNYIDPADAHVLRARGFLPWWADQALRIRFLRPLPSLALWSEYKAGASALWMHAHSFVWWGASAWLSNKMYRARISDRAARIATLIFALAPFHVVPIAWLANREALMSMALSICALRMHFWSPTSRSRWAKRWQPSITALTFAAALSSGEYAIAACGYVLAEALIIPRAWVSRALRTLPALGPAVAYLALRSAYGYGASGSGFYTDPLSTPSAFLARAPDRFARLMLDAWGGLDGETLRGHVPAVWVLMLFGGLCALLWRPVRAVCTQETSRVYLLGSVLSAIPFLSVVPSPRLLGMSMLGIAPVVALILERAWWPETEARSATSPSIRFAALVLGFSQLVHGPASSWLMSRSWSQAGRTFERDARELKAELGDAASADVSVLRGVAGAFFVPFALSPSGAPPRAWRLLSQAGHVLVRRVSERELELVAGAEQSLVPIGPGNLFRPEGKGFSVGEQYDASGMRVTVVETSQAGVRRLRVVFSQSESTRWMIESGAGFRLTALPEVGFGTPLPP